MLLPDYEQEQADLETSMTPEQRREEERRCKKRAWNRTYMRWKYEREKAERVAAEMVEIGATVWVVPEISL